MRHSRSARKRGRLPGPLGGSSTLDAVSLTYGSLPDKRAKTPSVGKMFLPFPDGRGSVNGVETRAAACGPPDSSDSGVRPALPASSNAPCKPNELNTHHPVRRMPHL